MENITPTISAIVLAKNEEARIDICLANLSWVDEIIVIDNGSTDKTKEIAKKHSARIITSMSTDFSALRTLGQKQAKGQWMLYIDADEEVPPALRKEIETIVEKFDSMVDPHGYRIRRKNYYLGHEWPYEDGMLRFFYAPSLKGWVGSVHETAQVDGRVGTLAHSLIHKTHRSLEEMVTKTNVWSEEEALLRLRHGHPPIVWWRLLRVMVTGFWDSFIRQGGWRAGTLGWVESVYQAFSMFITYAKLWELQQKEA